LTKVDKPANIYKERDLTWDLKVPQGVGHKYIAYWKDLNLSRLEVFSIY